MMTATLHLRPQGGPIELAASYRLDGYQVGQAALHLEVDLPEETFLSVLHEGLDGETMTYTLVGHDQLSLQVQSWESLSLIVRRDGRIVGALVNEVCCDESSRNLLLPKGGYNLIVYQVQLVDAEEPVSFSNQSKVYEVITQ